MYNIIVSCNTFAYIVILCETESGKILFLVGRLFSDGNLYIITAYWAEPELQSIYTKESEVLKNE